MRQRTTRMVLPAAIGALFMTFGTCADERLPNGPQSAQSADPIGSSSNAPGCAVSVPKCMCKPALPSPDQIAAIESITVSAYCHPLAPIAKDVAAFKLPKKYHKQLIDYFRDANLDSYVSTEDNEIGTAHVIFKGGTNLRICWFYVGHKSRMSFSCCGVRYKKVGEELGDDEALVVDAFISRASKEISAHEHREAKRDGSGGQRKRDGSRNRSN